MANAVLSQEQEREAERVAVILEERLKGDWLGIARLLVSRKDSEFFGKTEFELRDRVHELGAKAMQTVLEERKKAGTKGRA